MTAPESFGKAVRAWREAEGKTQEDLAELLGLSQSRISEIENGRYENVRFKSAIYLTNKTGWPLEDLAAQLDPDYKIRKDQTRHTGGINPPHGTKEVPQHVAAIGLLELKDSSLRGIREEIRQAIGLLSRAERNAKRAIDGKASRTTSHHRSRRGRGGRRGA